MDLYNTAKQCQERDFAKKLNFVENEIVNKYSFDDAEKQEFLHKFSYIKSEIKSRWLAANRTEQVFLKRNHDWLQGTVEIPDKKKEKVGRPSKSFEDSSARSKRRKTKPLREVNTAEELLYAGQMNLRKSGNLEGAKVVADITKTPTRGAKYRKAFKVAERLRRQLTPVQALALFIEANLSRKQYEIIRNSDKKLYPCYTLIQRAKQECYPIREAYHVTATTAEVRLQSLLNHTAQRLLLYLEDVLETFNIQNIASLELVYKWGCDGSQQSQYKQKFENICDSDVNIFQSSLVPLQLVCCSNNRVIWQNPTPSSPRYCRPMRIRFIHESVDVTNEELHYFGEQIGQLEETKVARSAGEVSVKHTMLLTMVDGKVCNAATQTTSTMRCYICKATSKDFNKLIEPKEVDVNNLKFGLSTLHARIRFFESLLHLSYKIPIQKWQVRLETEKDVIKNRKREIQEKFKVELGLIVDVPKPGYGSSNDGNTSRRFFANAKVSSEITGVDLNLIERFGVILEVISSGYKINVERFSEYCRETAKLYVELYSWHPMSPTVHKILIHGSLVVQHALLPIGILSEEAAEARNKHFRQYRQNFSRKFSREDSNFDILNRLLLTSDPYMSSIRPKTTKKSKPFRKEALAMLLPPEVENIGENTGDSDNTDISEEDLEENSDISDEEGWE